MAENIFDLSPDDFRATIEIMQANGSNTDELVREYRSRSSLFAPINNAADAQHQGLADRGRRSVAGGLLSKQIGTTGMDALRSIDFEGMGGLLGMGQALGRTIDAPSAAAAGLIPQSDMDAEALGTAGFAMGAGGAATAPSGALRSGLARGAGLNEAQRQARDILDMRAAGRAGEVTDDMMARADDQYMFNNTPLPMDEASRLARADAAGFNPAFHGTGADISAVDPSFFGNGQDLLGTGFYTTTNPSRAERYVPRRPTPSIERSNEFADGGNVMPLLVREPRPFMLDEPVGAAAQEISDVYASDPFFKVNEMSSGVRIVGDDNGQNVMLDPYQQRHWALQGMRKAYGPDDTSNVLSEAGYSGVSGPEGAGNRVMLAYDPSNIRSRFARFDPEFSHLSNLSAANASPTAGLLAMQQEQDKPLPFMEMLRGLLR